jgi:hypothetical protein
LRVVAYIPDLLFGSGVLSALSAAGHEVVLAGDADSVDRALPGAQVLVVDLTSEVVTRLQEVSRHTGAVRTLAFYSHVESEVRAAAVEAGIDLVVPRSRMAREAPALVDRLSAHTG